VLANFTFFQNILIQKGTHEEILKFVDGFFPHEKFTWFEKGEVNGSGTREVYSFLKRELPNHDGTGDIRWNFAKFLVDHEGKPYKRYGPKTAPLDMKDDIEELLKRKQSS
jgi:glutathione peroxidase